MVWAMIGKTIKESDLIVIEHDLTSPSPGYTSRSHVADLKARLLEHYSGKVFQQDNARIHTPLQAMGFLRDHRVRVIDDSLPNSPDLNPIERIRVHLKCKAYEIKPDNE
ncbi:hypothetical protein K470DRAFT_264895 [Piedraia hortae CBS 480.64]|uniref:Tc1-like transposase DDE domain-containing protein n=1 Tax=Piedraia hortae CBS 480.64 TaxID=1314780 RepID=A0A6A7BXV3_9PEZI|nr:hypothetical protein K470DRAFT_264895 [Piedraia hortae CBS 480.64]